MHSSDEERRLFSFDEELERQQRRGATSSAHCAPVYHIGRGGQGNLIDEKERRRGSGGSDDSAHGRKGSLEWIKGITGRKGSS